MKYFFFSWIKYFFNFKEKKNYKRLANVPSLESVVWPLVRLSEHRRMTLSIKTFPKWYNMLYVKGTKYVWAVSIENLGIYLLCYFKSPNYDCSTQNRDDFLNQVIGTFLLIDLYTVTPPNNYEKSNCWP